MPFSRTVVATSGGPGWIDLALPRETDRGLLLALGHGAGGSVDAPDLQAVAAHALRAGVAVALITQPYRVAGRKAPPAAAALDAAWQQLVAHLMTDQVVAGRRLVLGGRSSGARVACRCARSSAVVPVGVLALAFPVHPPGKPESSRIDELNAVTVPCLVIQGRTDPFGMPGRRRGRSVVAVEGDHSLRRSAEAVGVAAARWLTRR